MSDSTLVIYFVVKFVGKYVSSLSMYTSWSQFANCMLRDREKGYVLLF